ncbi:hypothetical protein LV564_08730 [Komagataeibacter nataicola]|uniref:hypothetical protein n=1 Tax=Komagataeibacter nataicola TaxID=265960 RepID=UPI001428AC1A|nr:hypothetical protein [Komagataeibacter nataicola]WEQ57116.1 hypothetical protein LV564_08730 [Komagataeibacter nataicola]WNM08661.1 hypothetical protein RI056_17960 [Komagataeibacter nataicola]GBR25911.1 hypothetical protein AA0616_3077 [Komagataeibacter nataicola NRIC 0616]
MFVGIDLGITAIKAVLADGRQQMPATSSHPLRIRISIRGTWLMPLISACPSSNVV